MTLTPANILGKFVAGTTVAQIPVSAMGAAKYIIADCIGAIIGGVSEPDINALIGALIGQCSRSSHGDASVLGTKFKADRATASLIHGTAGTVLEMDEGHQFARGHPGMHVLPALLAYSEGRDVKGDDFLRAFILGYDVAARIGAAVQMNSHMHPHGTWGGIGSAAALAAIEGCSADDTARLIDITSSLTLATSRNTMLEGGTVRNAYTGVSNQMAHLAMALLKAGFSGEKDGISSVFGNVVSSNFDADVAFEQLGERYEVCRNYYKLHACCRFNHAALDALFSLMADNRELRAPHNINDVITAIDVYSYNLAAELDNTHPRNVLACKFSIPFAIATTLFHQSSGVMSFTEDARSTPAIMELSGKVRVHEDKAMTAQLPALRPGLVAITMADGRVLTAGVTTNRGDWQDPYSAHELHEKYISLTTRLWAEDKAVQVYDAILGLEDHMVDDVINIMMS